ncbi:MAG: carbonic anhydrase [Acetobacteraceae bacterium]|nr:carbonic anhydrase [Acetobacteraceae bacterium]
MASPSRIARRKACAGIFLGASALTLPVAGLLVTPPARAQTALTAEAALDQLMAGNARFVGRRLTSFEADLDILKQQTVTKQDPFAAVLSCADSRVPVEIIFDQSIGHVFVARIAGNVCTPEIIASLEYGAAVLGTAAIVVLGHSNCGAVKATIEAKAVPGQISALYAPLRPAVDRAGQNLEAAIRINAQIQAALLRTASPVIAGLVQQKKLKVIAGYYELGSGKVSLLS